MTSPQLSSWTGAFGASYLERNQDVSEADLAPRARVFARVLAECPTPPGSILEIGSNIGRNLAALARSTEAELHAVEPFAEALEGLGRLLGTRVASARQATAQSLPFADASIDLVFTSGVMIHIPPSDLHQAASEIVRVARRYVWCNEYFAKEPTTIPYRGRDDLLFKRDFGRFYLESFPSLRPLAQGFCWSATTPFDDTTWWLFEKH